MQHKTFKEVLIKLGPILCWVINFVEKKNYIKTKTICNEIVVRHIYKQWVNFMLKIVSNQVKPSISRNFWHIYLLIKRKIRTT